MRLTRRGWIGALAASLLPGTARAQAAGVFDVRSFGAKGDGRTLDTAAVQAAVDAAAQAGGGQVRLGKRGRFLIGQVELRGGIDFHIDAGAQLLVSTDPAHYPDPTRGVLHANGANRLSISGKGVFDGRSPAFMERYDAAGEWWVPKTFRPRLLVLENVEGLAIRDLTIRRAPSWTVHLVGCRKVLVENITIANQMDVPNCDGIDPDHCQEVEIRNCRITCGDDAIVIKTTAGNERYGPSHNIWVHDCVLETQDSGLKIGTETVQDIHDIRFERCEIVRGCRGLTIQLRDAGSVYNVRFRDIRFTAQYFSAPWWGRGEAISFTALPRNPETRVGTIHNVAVENVTGRAENSIRVRGSDGARIHDIAFRNVVLTLGRWTKYPGGVFDNRPTRVAEPIEQHGTPGFHLAHADRIAIDDCEVRWEVNPPAYFTHALEIEDATAVRHDTLRGAAARPSVEAVRIVR